MYHVFAGLDYYPAGGMGDYRGVFATIEEARDAVKESDWAEVAVFENGQLIVKNEIDLLSSSLAT